MSSTLDEPTRTAAASEQPTRAFLMHAGAGDVLPAGWELTAPAIGTTARLAFDPKRHTVVHDLGGPTPHESIRDALDRAGFESHTPAGARSNFLVRDRTLGHEPPRTAPAPSVGRGR